MASSSLEGELKVIDSYYGGVNSDVRRQLLQIYGSRAVDGKLKIDLARCQVSISSQLNSRFSVLRFLFGMIHNLRNFQRQTGKVSCGYFAVAHVVEQAATGHNRPESLVFDQSAMAGHLLACLKERRLTPFPKAESAERKKGKKFAIDAATGSPLVLAPVPPPAPLPYQGRQPFVPTQPVYRYPPAPHYQGWPPPQPVNRYPPANAYCYDPNVHGRY
ncbi:MAG: hypothetical protein GY740_18470 [Gammaproteobacteria bacterium]|nr:hypothetical protein [Gammaproteobacteria bacterium]